MILVDTLGVQQGYFILGDRGKDRGDNFKSTRGNFSRCHMIRKPSQGPDLLRNSLDRCTFGSLDPCPQ